ncbi:MAG: pacearchaeosortase [archaeon]
MKKRIFNIFLRYVILVLAGLSNFYIFYLIFTPLTIYPLYYLFSIFFETEILKNVILVGNYEIKMVEACIAGAAYYLLFALNLSTPMNLKKRAYALLFTFFSFFIINILRVFILTSILVTYDKAIFDFVHLFFWYVFSTLVVVFLWILTVKAYEIKAIPAYTDIKFIWDLGKESRLKKKLKKSKKSKTRK